MICWISGIKIFAYWYNRWPESRMILQGAPMSDHDWAKEENTERHIKAVNVCTDRLEISYCYLFHQMRNCCPTQRGICRYRSTIWVCDNLINSHQIQEDFTELNKFRYNGNFKNDSIEKILNTIKTHTNFSFERKGDTISINNPKKSKWNKWIKPVLLTN